MMEEKCFAFRCLRMASCLKPYSDSILGVNIIVFLKITLLHSGSFLTMCHNKNISPVLFIILSSTTSLGISLSINSLKKSFECVAFITSILRSNLTYEIFNHR